jgi:hypothetical protein
MNRPILCLALLAVAATASCKKAEAPDPALTDAPESMATVPAATALPAPLPTATGPVDTAAADEIPSALQGMWGMNEADCDRSRGDAKGNLRIGPKKLEFFEAVARLGKVQARDAGAIRATYGFEGEGQSWTMDVALEVQDGGKRLVRRDSGPDAMPGALQYLRCG